MADEREQDGLGRDAAHGNDRPATSGGSYGRNPGRSGDDLLDTGADVPRGTDEHAEDRTDEANAVDLDERPDVSRRDPTR